MSTTARHLRTLAVILSLPIAVACSGDDDDGTVDPARDAGFRDGGVRDAGDDTRDAGDDDRDGGVTPRDGGETPRDGGASPRDGGPPDIRIPGVINPVQVKFDDDGMLHVRCQTDDDCFAAQGYFHAAHRFAQMDIRRRFSSGRLAELFGPLALDNDRALRHLISTRTGGSVAEQIWNASSMQSQAMVTAYTRGVNAWIDDLRNNRNGADLPPEYQAYRNEIVDWVETDSVACVLALIESLTNSSDTEIRVGELFSDLPPALAADAFGLGPGSRSTIIPQMGTFAPQGIDLERRLAASESIRARLDHTTQLLANARHTPRFLTPLDGKGSNNWVLAPSQTSGNSALLANDPHLGMTQPSVWYLASIDSKQGGGNIHVAGASFAGLPGVLIGQNEDIAWGATTTFFDMADVYVETLNANGDGVMFNGNSVPFTEVDFTFRVFGGQPVTETFRYVPHHGPVVAIDQNMGMALTIKWTGAEADTDLDFLWGMMTATSVTEGRTALENVTTIGQNWVIIDRAGDIGWFPYNRVPIRQWASAMLPPWLPLPGDGSAEWGAYVAYQDLPQALNPPEGYIATANNDMTGHLFDGDPTNDGQPAIQNYVAVGYRHERIVERIVGDTGNHTLQSMQNIQSDVHSLLGERIAPVVLAAVNGAMGLDADGMLVQQALTAWAYQCPTGLIGNQPDSPPNPDPTAAAESAGCAAFHALWPRIVRGAFQDELDANSVSRAAFDEAAIRLITNPGLLIGGTDYWDDLTTMSTTETNTDILVAAMNSAGAWLTANLGATVNEWRWGRVHTLTLVPDLLGQITDRFNNGPFCNDGGLYTVDVANPGGRYSDNYAHASGASMRLACEAESAQMSCTIELPGGQSAFPSSPHYDDLLQEYLENVPTAIPFTTQDIDNAAVQELTIMAP